MAEELRIFTVYPEWNGALNIYSVPVKETPKGYRVIGASPGLEFGCHSVFQKSKYRTYSFTKEEAIAAFIKSETARIHHAKSVIIEATEQIKKAGKL